MEIFNQLETKQTTHPILCRLWKTHLIHKLEQLKQELENCNKTIQLMDTIPDLSPEQALLLYNLNLNSL